MPSFVCFISSLLHLKNEKEAAERFPNVNAIEGKQKNLLPKATMQIG